MASEQRPTLPSIREMLGDPLPAGSKPPPPPPSFALAELHDSLVYDAHPQHDVVVVPPRTQSSRGVSPPDSPESSISSHYSSSTSDWTPPSSASHADGGYVKTGAVDGVDLSSFRLRAEPETAASGHAHPPSRPSLLGLAQAAASAWAQQPSDLTDQRRHTVDASARRRSHAGPPATETRYRNRLLHHPDLHKPIQHARTASLPDFVPIPAAQHPLRSAPYPQASQPDARGPSISVAINVHPSPPSPTLETARPRARAPALVDSSSALRIQPRSSVTAHELRRDNTEIIRYKDVNGKIATTASKASSGKYGCTFCPKRFNRPSSLKIHLNTHTGEKPYQCPVPGCGRHFSVMSNMRRHQRNSHNTDEIPASSGPHLQDMLSEEGPEAGMDTDDDLPSRPSTSGSYASRLPYDGRSSGSKREAVSTPPVSLHMPSSHFARHPHYDDAIHPMVSTGQRVLQRQHA